MTIELKYTVGYYDTKLILSEPYGAGGGYHIYIDNWYHGQVCKMFDGWHVYLTAKSELCSNDIVVILETMEKASKQTSS